MKRESRWQKLADVAANVFQSAQLNSAFTYSYKITDLERNASISGYSQKAALVSDQSAIAFLTEN